MRPGPLAPRMGRHSFPIIPAPTDTFVFGPMLLQQEYVIADFESDHQNFSVYQSIFPGTNAEETLVPIYNSSVETQLNTKPEHLSGGVIADIIVGCVVFVTIILGIVSVWQLWFVKKRGGIGCADRTKRKSSSGRIFNSLYGTAADSSLGLEANAPRIRPHHGEEISELSSDAEHERIRRVNTLESPTIIEMEDKSDATQWQLNAQRVSEMPQTPHSSQEVE
jgi:hypothetical protein